MSDPATREWQQPLGESTSARLRRVEAELGSALRALAEAQKPCAWRGLAIDAMREQPNGIYPARAPVGTCTLCGDPIVRGHWVEARHDSTTRPQWAHAAGVCPDEGPS